MMKKKKKKIFLKDKSLINPKEIFESFYLPAERNICTKLPIQLSYVNLKTNIYFQVLEALTSYEPELLTCGAPPPSVSEPTARTLALLADIYDKELVGVIGWAKQIPGFTDLALNDQVRTGGIFLDLPSLQIFI